jgi:pullulanase
MTSAIRYYAPTLPHPADHLVCEKPLGAIYKPDKTLFRVWAPTASKITLNVYHRPYGGRPQPVPLARNEDGSWEITLAGDCLGVYYTYSVAGEDVRFDAKREVLDPYAKAVTAHNGRCMVVNDKTPMTPRPSFPLSEAIIYEMHLRDFTLDPDSGVQRRGKYLGLTEAHTHLTGRRDIATGLRHLVELGVNVVQLLPIGTFHSDAANDRYGWGYDAIQHCAPEGWYATERADERRIREVKEMISALHAHGIRVTLDVVFNHTFEAIDKGLVFNFEGLVPSYYYRLKQDGSYWNGSGTGNEFRSEAPMARRYILDCLKHWVNEYQVDGFRFDLLGLTDRVTVELIVKELHAIDPNLLLYGEPWAGGGTPIEITSKGMQRGQGWAAFNDHFRDAVKGQVFDARARGFIQAGTNIHSVKRGLRAALEDFTDAPTETINYLECHDNHTLWDRLLISTLDDAHITIADRRAMAKLGALVLLTAQGIPFLHAGQEFLRSKGGDHNSYDKPDAVNMLRWALKAENADVYEYYRGLIALRRAHPLLRLATAAAIRAGVKFFDDDLHQPVPESCVAMQLSDESSHDAWSRALVLFNATAADVTFTLPSGTWEVFVNARQSGLHALDALTTRARVEARSGMLLAEPRKKNE